MSDPIDVIVTLTAALPVVAVDAQIYPYGNVTVSSGTGLAMVGQKLSLGTASGSTSGALTSTDWNTFSNKVTFPGYSATAPSAAGTANAGASANAARADHVHPAQTTITGNAATATALATARAINGVTFDGTSAITITAAALTLTGTTLNSGVVTSSLTSVGILTVGTWNAGVISGQYGGTGVANTGKTITLGGSFLTSSAIQFNCTGSLAFVGPTTGCTFTLPSSSAWLARTDAAQTFAGVQSFSSVPVFLALTRTSVYLNAAQTLTVSVYDIVKFDTVEFGSGFNTGTNSYTVPYTGYLKVTGAIGVNVCSGGLFVVTVYNGSTMVKRCFSSNNYMSGSINPFSVIIPVTAADSITIRVYSSPAAQLFNNSSDTWCQFEMLPN